MRSGLIGCGDKALGKGIDQLFVVYELLVGALGECELCRIVFAFFYAQLAVLLLSTFNCCISNKVGEILARWDFGRLGCIGAAGIIVGVGAIGILVGVNIFFRCFLCGALNGIGSLNIVLLVVVAVGIVTVGYVAISVVLVVIILILVSILLGNGAFLSFTSRGGVVGVVASTRIGILA